MSNKKKRKKLIYEIKMLKLQLQCLSKEVDFYHELSLSFYDSDNLAQLIDLKQSFIQDLHIELTASEYALLDLDLELDCPERVYIGDF